MARQFLPPPSQALTAQLAGQLGGSIGQARQRQAQAQAAEQQKTLLTSLLTKENPTAQDFINASIAAPQQRQAIQDIWKRQTAEEQESQLKFSGQVMAAFDTDSDIGIDLLKDKAERERARGDEEEARVLEQFAGLAETDPKGFAKRYKLFIAALPGGDKLLKAASESGLNRTDPVQSSEILPDGTVQIVRKSGAVEVKTVPEAQRTLVKQARQFGAEIQGLRAGERKAATKSIDKATEFFDKIEPLQKNIKNLTRGIELIDQGAETGVIANLFPSIQQASVELDNLQGRLGLDVLSTTTFGALSEKELEFALSTALPTKLEGEKLKAWLRDKREAQRKAIKVYSEAALFLGRPGNSISDFIAMKKKEQKEREATQAPAPTAEPKATTVGRFQIEVIE